ncbi:MAG: ADOP family duplicated permease [Gemmatimonadales bacterium]
MRRLSELLFRLRALLGMGKMERELDEEVAFHVEMETRKYLAQGFSPEAARAQALAAFGPVTRQKQTIRDGWGIGLVRDALHDTRLALRQLRFSPGFTATVLVTLALGIGATTAIASIARQVLLRSAPVEEPDRLVAVYTSCRRGDLRCTTSYPDYLSLQSGTTSLTDLAAISTIPLNLGTEETAFLATGELVTGNYFSLLGVAPHLGRLIQQGDDRQGGANAVVVLSYDFWRTALGADSSVVGRTVQLNQVPFEVIGIGPRGYAGLQLARPRDLWLPMFSATTLGSAVGAAGSPDTYENRRSRWAGPLIGRLADGAELGAAQAELRTIGQNLAAEYPEEWAAVGGSRQVTVDPAGRYILPVGREAELRDFLFLLLGTVAFALLLASANVANLLLARATARGRELGVQLAVGASRARLVRKLVTESLVLGLLGSAAGLGVAALMLRLLSSYELPGGVAISGLGITLDRGLLALAIGLAISTSLLFGLAPAWHATRQDLIASIKGGVNDDGRGVARVRRGLVTVQVALCLILLAGSAVFARTLRNSLRADLGYQPDRSALLRFNTSLLRYTPEQSTAMRAQLLERVRALPEVSAAAIATLTPFQGGGFQGFFATIGGYAPAPNEEIRFDAVMVTDGYFEALGIPIVDGRPIAATDGPDAPPVAVINRHAAELYWKGRSPVGGTISFGDQLQATVVGVTDNPTWQAIGEDPTPFVFLPLDQLRDYAARGFLTLAIRTPGDPASAVRSAAAAFREVVPGLSPSVTATMETLIGETLMPQRLGSMLLTSFGALALVLAGVGIYGVVGYGVTQRAREIGIRIAIGASQVGVMRSVFLDMTGPVLVGLAVGIGGSLALARTVASFTYQADPADPLALGLVALVLLLIGGVATLIPARRAARIDPVRVLSID